MENHILDNIKAQLNDLSKSSASANLIYRQGHSLYLNGQCTQLSASENHFEFSVNDKYGDYVVKIDVDENVQANCECNTGNVCRHRAAALMQLHEFVKLDDDTLPPAGIKYTRSGMIKRVVDERKIKAEKAQYTINYADNIFGEHILTNERGIEYKLTFRDTERKHGYCSCPDYRTNKLGTCKHLIFAFENLNTEEKSAQQSLPKYPFIEVFLNPFRDYKISWFYPEKIYGEVAELFYRYFGNKNFIEDKDAEKLLGFFNNAEKYKQILVRPEVYDKMEKMSELSTLKGIEKKTKLNFDIINTKLLPYQKQGVEFATFRKGSVIADEIGLGKSLQAIATAMMKKEVFGFVYTLIICPAILKNQWKKEIEKYTNEKAKIIEGTPEERLKMYAEGDEFFRIVNYETVIRDIDIIAKFPVDFIVLVEAQRIRNYASQTSVVLKSIDSKHALVLSGMPIESELIDLYSIILFVDPDLLSPLWEFSYQHCYFDSQTKNTIVGYYGLQELKQKLSDTLIRREKQQVIKQLPNISEINNLVKLSGYQKKMHIKFAREVLDIFNKKIISSFDVQKAMQLIKKMRMLTGSSFLIDDTTNISPKLDELKHILSYKLHIKKSNHKVVVFTEWKKMVNIIARMLRLSKINFVEVTEETSPEKRAILLKKFEEDESCKIFLCTDLGGKGIDLQLVDTVVNMEIPRSNNETTIRLGRIDELGRRKENLTIINIIGEDSIEEKMADGHEFDEEFVKTLFNFDDTNKVVGNLDEMQKRFREAISETVELMILSGDDDSEESRDVGGQMKLEFGEEEITFDVNDESNDEVQDFIEIKPSEAADIIRIDQREIEDVLKSGVNFLSHLLKISTGRAFNLQEDKLDFNPETGEITLKFKIRK